MKSIIAIPLLFVFVSITSFYTNEDIRFTLGDNSCILRKTIIKEGALTLIALHDNENTAVEAFHSWTDQLNINLLELHQRDDRYLQLLHQKQVFEIDPNMIFTEAGIEKTLSRNSKKIPPELNFKVKLFADSLLSLFIDSSGKKYVVAIHNNTPDNFSVLTYKNSKNAAEVYISPTEDIDDFFIVTEGTDFQYLKNMKLNVVLQSKDAEDDGSLSVYCQQHGIPYINIEAEHGHLQQQIDMIKIVNDLVTEKK